MNKPKPIAYTTEEGGFFKPFRSLATPGVSVESVADQRCIFAVFFEDGSVFDAIIGWREESDCSASVDEIKNLAAGTKPIN